jgi:RNA polymerase sigma-70 factor (ECF subfamily)
MNSIEPEIQDSLTDDPSHRPEDLAMHGQLRKLLEARIDLLPEAFRTVFMLRVVEEMSVEEVSQALGIAEATVRTRLFRARSLLREGLASQVDVALNDTFAFDGARCDRIVACVLARATAGGLSG